MLDPSSSRSANASQAKNSLRQAMLQNIEPRRSSADRPLDCAGGERPPHALSSLYFLQSSGLRGISTDFNVVVDQKLGRTLQSRSWELHRFCK
jgi:hypothetical protein